MIQYNNHLYQSNLQKLLNDTDYKSLVNLFNTTISNNIITGALSITSNDGFTSTINIGFQPKVVLYFSEFNQDDYIATGMINPLYGALIRIITSQNTTSSNYITSNGFRMGCFGANAIQETVKFYYIAFK